MQLPFKILLKAPRAEDVCKQLKKLDGFQSFLLEYASEKIEKEMKTVSSSPDLKLPFRRTAAVNLDDIQ